MALSNVCCEVATEMEGRGQEQRFGERQIGKVESGEEGVGKGWMLESTTYQIMNLLLIHSTNGTSDPLEAYYLYKKIDINQMTHAFTKVVLNLLCNKHGKYYAEKSSLWELWPCLAHQWTSLVEPKDPKKWNFRY